MSRPYGANRRVGEEKRRMGDYSQVQNLREN